MTVSSKIRVQIDAEQKGHRTDVKAVSINQRNHLRQEQIDIEFSGIIYVERWTISSILVISSI